MFLLPTKLVSPTENFKYSFNVSITNMEELIKNIKQILKSADLVYDNQDYTSATMLYFKAFFITLDYIILKKQGKTPKDHTERFRILEADFPELYELLDRNFPTYRQTYSTTIPKDKCEEIKKDVKETIEKYNIPINN